MLGWNIDLDNKEVKEVFRELQGKVENMRPVMKEASETMYHAVIENFDTEGKRLDGGGWADLSDATKEQRSRTKKRARDKDTKEFRRYKRDSKKTGAKKGDYITRNVKPSWVETLLPSGKTERESGKILQVTGQLEDSISADYDEFSAVVGTNDIRAATHQFGDPDRNIPGRSFLELTDGDLDKIENDALKWLEK
jgi:phage gpG-like protein